MPEISTGMAAIAEKVASQTTASSGADAGASKFAKLMDGDKLDVSRQALEVFGLSPEKEIKIKSISAEGMEMPKVAEISSQSEIRTQNKAMDLLGQMNLSAVRMENMTDLISNPNKSFSPRELLAAQAGLQQMMMEVEMGGKLMEHASTSTKTVLQQQIA